MTTEITVKIDARDEELKFTLSDTSTVDVVARVVDRLSRLYLDPDADTAGRPRHTPLRQVEYRGISAVKLVEDETRSDATPHVHWALPAEELLYDKAKANDDGSRVNARDLAAEIAPEAVPLTAQENAGPAPWEAQAAPAPVEKKSGRRTNEEIAAENGVNLDDVKEWKGGGRITKGDIEEFAKLHANAVNNQTLDEAAQGEAQAPPAQLSNQELAAEGDPAFEPAPAVQQQVAFEAADVEPWNPFAQQSTPTTPTPQQAPPTGLPF